jgi:DNA (cytosine-5)-methyltransferase 1
VAQRRKRVFVVGYLGDWRPAAAVLFERDSLSGNPAPSREAQQEVTGTLSSRTSGGGGLGTDFECAGGLQPVNTYQNVSHCLNAGGMGRIDYETESFVVHGTQDPCTATQAFALGRNNGAENTVCVTGKVAHTLRGEGFDASEDGTGRGTPMVMCFAQNTRDEVREMPYAGALAANPGMKQTSYARIGMAVRRLTPVECERLQGFPDNFTQIPYRGKTVDKCPDGPRYKSLGNSMAVPCMKWIGERIQQVQEITQNNKVKKR